MANPKHLKILEQGVAIWNNWRENNPDIEPNLAGASLKNKNLAGIDFSNANLRSSNFTGCDLSLANLSRAKIGLRKIWLILLTIFSWILALISGWLASFFGRFGGLIFLDNRSYQVIGWISLIFFALFVFIIINRRIKAIPIAIAVAIVITISGIGVVLNK